MNNICKVTFHEGVESEYSRYAIYRGYDGKLLDWMDLEYLIEEENRSAFPDLVKDSIGCTGTAFFRTLEETEQVLKAL